MGEIQFIYFDVGGVLILDLTDTNKWVPFMDDLGVKKSRRAEFDKFFSDFEDLCNVGEKSMDEIIDILKQKFGLVLPMNYSIQADIVSRFDPNPAIDNLLKKINGRYKIGMLTNMYPSMLDQIQDRKLIHEAKWDAVVDSSVVGYRKPQDEIYQIAEKYSVVDPHKILFVDNRQENLDVAKLRGWKVFLYDPQDVFKSSQRLSEIL